MIRMVVAIRRIRCTMGATAALSRVGNSAVEIGLVGIGRRLGDNARWQHHAALARPIQSFRGRVTTTIAPALFGRRATAGVMLAWEWFVARFVDARPHRNTDCHDQIRA
jgi:hypothetical protein